MVGAFAKETINLARFIRERTPLGVQGLVGEDASSVANRRPLGLRAISDADSDDAKVFVADDQFVTDGRAPGIAAEMDGGVWDSESPLAPLKGGDQ